MNIYVGNLSFQTTEEDLQNAFTGFGQVVSVAIIKDKFSGQSRGFAFVEMADKAEAQAAIEGLNGRELQGRTLTVNEARPRTENRDRGGNRFNRGGSGGSGDRNRRSGGSDRRRNW